MNLKCPKCGSSNVCEILYGMPTGEAYKLAEQGKMILGGCDIIIDDLPQPDYGCLDCKFEWAPELLPASYMVKIRFKVWTSIGISEDIQRCMKCFRMDWFGFTGMREHQENLSINKLNISKRKKCRNCHQLCEKS